MVGRTVRRIAAGIAFAAGAAAILSNEVRAHEMNVHQMLTSAAIEFLIQQQPEMAACDVPELRQTIGEAVWDEDDGFGGSEILGRFLFHFLPRLNDELTDATPISTNVESTCDSTAWEAGAPCSSRIGATATGPTPWSVSPISNEHDLFSTIERLKAFPPDKLAGWRGVGHMLHLLQDLTSPPHTQNDAHPPAPFLSPIGRPQSIFDASMYEVTNRSRPDVTNRFRVREDGGRAVGAIPWPPSGGLIDIQDPLAAMRQLQQIVSSRFPSEKTVNTHPAVVGRLQPPNRYVLDPATGKRIAVLEWGTGEYTIDRTAALEQFEALAPLAIQYSASMLAYFHKRAPLCEQQMRVRLSGVGRVTSSSDEVRNAPNDHLACGTNVQSQHCTQYFPSGKWVELTAHGDDFRGWSDPSCPGTGTCRVRMDGKDPKEITADFGDPLAGVYELVSFDGHPLPTPAIDESVRSVLSGQMRINEQIVGAPANTPVIAAARMLYVYRDPFFGGQERVVDTNPAYFYSVGTRSDVPVLFGFPFDNHPSVLLPPGLVLTGTNTFNQRSGIFATLSDDGRTLSVGHALGLFTSHIATYVRIPNTRTFRTDPVNREISFPATLQGTTQTAQQTITIVNTGADAITLHTNGIFSNGSGFPTDFVVNGGSCVRPSVVVPAGQSCEMTVTFRPQLSYRPGVRTDTYTIATNAGSVSGNNYTPVTFTFSGEATGSPEVTIDPPAANFLDTFAGTSSIPQTFIIRSSGALPLNLSSIGVSGGDFVLDHATCGFGIILDPGSACAISVVFRPVTTGETLARGAAIQVLSSAGSTSGFDFRPTFVPLSGTAVYRAPTANAGPDLDNVAPNTNVRLVGSASDPQGIPLTYAWTFLSRPLGSRAELLDASDHEARFVPDVDGEYIVSFEAGNRFVKSPIDTVSIRVLPGPPPVPPTGPAPRVTGIGELTLFGRWNVRFFGGDDDEEFWMKIGDDPEFEWDVDDMPIVTVDFPIGEGRVRIAEDDNGEDLMPLIIQPLSDGRYLLHLHDDDPPNEIELTLVLERVTPTP